jgi:CRISPR-associated protein Cst2
MMSNPVLTAAILIEANGAALNNAGNDAGQRLDNAVVVKQIKVGKNAYPYISGQAVRRWWREVLYADFGWKPSPVTREAKSAYTEGDPVQYPDDDVFGYMAAKKVKKAARKPKGEAAPGEASVPEGDGIDVSTAGAEGADDGASDSGGTQRRVSPLKNSLLVSVLPRTITSDFGHFSRDLPVDNPNMVPFEHEHYTALMQGVFTLSLQDVGRFECGLMRDLALNTSVPESVTVVHEAEGNLQPRVLGLSVEERRKRVAETLRALGHLRHGANLTRNLSDVAPVVVVMGYLDGGNAPFQNLFTPDGDEQVRLNLPRFVSVVKDYKDRLLGDKRLFFGYRPGVIANEVEAVAALKAGVEGVTFFVGTPGEAIGQVAALAQTDAVLRQE